MSVFLDHLVSPMKGLIMNSASMANPSIGTLSIFLKPLYWNACLNAASKNRVIWQLTMTSNYYGIREIYDYHLFSFLISVLMTNFTTIWFGTCSIFPSFGVVLVQVVFRFFV
jgi:hypothetical protein